MIKRGHALDERQPEPGAVVLPRQAAIQLHERLKQARQVILGNADTGIPDRHVDALSRRIAEQPSADG